MANELRTVVTADTSQFVNQFKNLKGATNELTNVVKRVREMGATFAVAEDEEIAFAKSFANIGTTATSAKGKLREIQNALTDITVAYRGMTDEEKNSPFGQALAQSMMQLRERAGEVKDAIMDVNASVKNAASDTRVFDQIGAGVGIVANGFQLAAGASALFGTKNKEMIAILTKVQGIMAVTNSLSAIKASLDKSQILYTTALIVKEKALAMAKQLEAQKTAAATVAQAAFNAVASANPYMLIIGAVGAAIALIASFIDITDDATESVDNLTEAQKKYNTEAEALGEIANTGAAKQEEWIQKFNDFKLMVNSASDSIDEQRNIVNKYNDDYGKMFGTVKTYAELQLKLNNQLEKAFKKRADNEETIAKYSAAQKMKIAAKAALAELTIQKAFAEHNIKIQRQAEVKKAQDNVDAAQSQYDSALKMNDPEVIRGAAAVLELRKKELEQAQNALNHTSLNSNSNIVKSMQRQTEFIKFIEEYIKKEFGNIDLGQIMLDTTDFKEPKGTKKTDNKKERKEDKDKREAEKLKHDLEAKVKAGESEIKQITKEYQTEKENIETEYNERLQILKDGEDAEIKLAKETGEEISAIQKKYSEARKHAQTVYNKDLEDAAEKHVNKLASIISKNLTPGQSKILEDIRNKGEKQLADLENQQEISNINYRPEQKYKKFWFLKMYQSPTYETDQLRRDKEQGNDAFNQKHLTQTQYIAQLRNNQNQYVKDELFKDVKLSDIEKTDQFKKYAEDIENAKIELQKLEEEQKRYNDLMNAKITNSEEEDKLEQRQKNQKEMWDALSNAVGLYSTAISALSSNPEDKGSKRAQIIGEALATLALSFAKAMDKASATGPWGWAAFGIAGMAQLLAMTAQLKSLNAGSYATGGIIGGNSYYGDRLTAHVNSGEMILNRRQQSNLFGMINKGDAMNGGNVEFEIRYDRLVGMMKNGERKNGKY